MPIFRILLSNRLLNICFLSWFFAQMIKTGLHWYANKKFVGERLLGAGGMPSSHSAMVTSLCVGMARASGFSSPTFALTVAFAAVVIHDAMGIRRAAGEQARVLNRMMFDFNDFTDAIKNHTLLEFYEEDDEYEVPEDKRRKAALKEYLGHTPLEVVAGSLLGILVAVCYPI